MIIVQVSLKSFFNALTFKREYENLKAPSFAAECKKTTIRQAYTHGRPTNFIDPYIVRTYGLSLFYRYYKSSVCDKPTILKGLPLKNLIISVKSMEFARMISR